ncbi:MAG: site-specific integrase [Mycobacteriales bacterium]
MTASEALSAVVSAGRFHPEAYARMPFDPFAFDPTTVELEDLPLAALHTPEIPIDLAIAVWRVVRRDSPSASTWSTGLKRLSRYRGHVPLGGLSAAMVEADLKVVHREWRERRQRQWVRINLIRDPRERRRRIDRYNAIGRADGLGAQENYRNALRSLYLLHSAIPGVGKPTEGVVLRKRGLSSRRALDSHEMVAMYNAALSDRDAELSLLVLDISRETAARRASLIGLNIEDIDLASGVTVLRTKGGKSYQVLLSCDVVMRILARARRLGWEGELLQDYDSQKPDSRATAALVRANGTRLTCRWFDEFFARVRKDAGARVPAAVSHHWLRHTTLTQIERVAGPSAASQWAGHLVKNDPREVTLGYTKFTLRERVELFNFMFSETPTGRASFANAPKPMRSAS